MKGKDNNSQHTDADEYVNFSSVTGDAQADKSDSEDESTSTNSSDWISSGEIDLDKELGVSSYCSTDDSLEEIDIDKPKTKQRQQKAVEAALGEHFFALVDVAEIYLKETFFWNRNAKKQAEKSEKLFLNFNTAFKIGTGSGLTEVLTEVEFNTLKSHLNGLVAQSVQSKTKINYEAVNTAFKIGAGRDLKKLLRKTGLNNLKSYLNCLAAPAQSKINYYAEVCYAAVNTAFKTDTGNDLTKLLSEAELNKLKSHLNVLAAQSAQSNISYEAGDLLSADIKNQYGAKATASYEQIASHSAQSIDAYQNFKKTVSNWSLEEKKKKATKKEVNSKKKKATVNLLHHAISSLKNQHEIGGQDAQKRYLAAQFQGCISELVRSLNVDFNPQRYLENLVLAEQYFHALCALDTPEKLNKPRSTVVGEPELTPQASLRDIDFPKKFGQQLKMYLKYAYFTDKQYAQLKKINYRMTKEKGTFKNLQLGLSVYTKDANIFELSLGSLYDTPRGINVEKKFEWQGKSNDFDKDAKVDECDVQNAIACISELSAQFCHAMNGIFDDINKQYAENKFDLFKVKPEEQFQNRNEVKIENKNALSNAILDAVRFPLGVKKLDPKYSAHTAFSPAVIVKKEALKNGL